LLGSLVVSAIAASVPTDQSSSSCIPDCIDWCWFMDAEYSIGDFSSW